MCVQFRLGLANTDRQSKSVTQPSREPLDGRRARRQGALARARAKAVKIRWDRALVSAGIGKPRDLLVTSPGYPWASRTATAGCSGAVCRVHRETRGKIRADIGDTTGTPVV